MKSVCIWALMGVPAAIVCVLLFWQLSVALSVAGACICVLFSVVTGVFCTASGDADDLTYGE